VLGGTNARDLIYPGIQYTQFSSNIIYKVWITIIVKRNVFVCKGKCICVYISAYTYKLEIKLFKI
jgi:hypothetical protein